jgi:tRNA/tmRNA/rRNA uracil-C5-methylase (TrmA/RlmC/RlmD family)
MNAGAELELTIHDVAFGGSGVGRHDGQVVFVPFTAPGERVRVRVVRKRKSFVEAELIAIESASPDRVEPRCPYFTRCGGCAYQHLAYPAQLAMKQQQVEQTLRRVGRMSEVPMRPIVPAPQDYGYRNRLRVHVGGGVAGFFAHGAHAIVDVEQCAIAAPVVNTALRELRRAPLPDGDYSLRAPGGGPFFEQTNPGATQELLALVRSQVRPDHATLVDAYCGAGLFSKHLADLFEEVVGIEENANAIAHARRNATERERYLHGDVAGLLGDLLATRPADRTTVILDPPAIGIAPRVADLLVAARPAELLYVSCNPATLARDLARLQPIFTVASVTPLDMFPQTAGIEVVVRATTAQPAT